MDIARPELDRPSWDAPLDTAERLIDLAGDAGGGGLRVQLGGGLIQAAQGAGEPELIGLATAAVVPPVALRLRGGDGAPHRRGAGRARHPGLAHRGGDGAPDVPDWAPAVAALIGIGVGIDYALLILTRFRTALAEAREVPDAVVEATRTAGHSVLVAGGTVVVSLLGLVLMGVSYLRGTAVAAILAVLVR